MRSSVVSGKFQLSDFVFNFLQFVRYLFHIFRGSITQEVIENETDVPDPQQIRWKFPKGYRLFGTNYECNLCNEKFQRESALSKHMKKHGKAIY